MFKSLLKENNNCILIPSYRVLGDLINIQEITEEFLNLKVINQTIKIKKLM